MIEPETILTFGKHKGKKASDLVDQYNYKYLKWMDSETSHKLSPKLWKLIYELEEYLQDQSDWYKQCRYNAKKSSGKSHEASYGQAFDRNMGHY